MDMICSSLIPELLTISGEAGKAILDVYRSEFAVEQKDDRSPLTLADRRSHEIITKGLAGLPGHKLPILSEEGRHIPYRERRDWDSFWLVDPLDGTKEFVKRNGEFTVNIALVRQSTPVLGIIFIPVKDVFYFGTKEIGSYRLETKSSAIFKSLDEILNSSDRLPVVSRDASVVTVVASRSHMSAETEQYVNSLKTRFRRVDFISAGSSLKFCILAEGKADTYPRFGPTMEWDTAAGQAILEQTGGRVFRADSGAPLLYNKENLLNPSFIAERNQE